MTRLSVAPGISHLFQELIDEIIDHLQYDDSAEYDVDSLKSSALISRVFRSRSQKHLFTNIGVYMTGSNVAQPMLERLNDVFSTNPRLASHVRIFALRLREAGNLWSQPFAHPHFVACLAHMLRSSDPYPSPGGLDIHLTTNDAYGQRLKAIALPRSQISIDLRTHFIPSVVKSRLTSIEICNLHDVPIALFDNCSNLSTLNIFGIKLAPFEESGRVPIENRPLIRELLVADSEDLICRTGLRFDGLERLVFQGTLEEEDMATMQHIFNSNLLSLEYLNFFNLPACRNSNIDAYLYPEIGADFSRMPNLRELKPSSWLPSQPKHKVKRIDIFFNCCMDLRDFEMSQWRALEIEAHLRTGNWAALDSMIMRIASAAEHPLELCITVEYFIELDHNIGDVEAARVADKATLENWGVLYLPCTSKSPKIVMEVITEYSDHYYNW